MTIMTFSILYSMLNKVMSCLLLVWCSVYVFLSGPLFIFFRSHASLRSLAYLSSYINFSFVRSFLFFNVRQQSLQQTAP